MGDRIELLVKKLIEGNATMQLLTKQMYQQTLVLSEEIGRMREEIQKEKTIDSGSLTNSSELPSIMKNHTVVVEGIEEITDESKDDEVEVAIETSVIDSGSETMVTTMLVGLEAVDSDVKMSEAHRGREKMVVSEMQITQAALVEIQPPPKPPDAVRSGTTLLRRVPPPKPPDMGAQVWTVLPPPQPPEPPDMGSLLWHDPPPKPPDRGDLGNGKGEKKTEANFQVFVEGWKGLEKIGVKPTIGEKNPDKVRANLVISINSFLNLNIIMGQFHDSIWIKKQMELNSQFNSCLISVGSIHETSIPNRIVKGVVRGFLASDLVDPTLSSTCFETWILLIRFLECLGTGEIIVSGSTINEYPLFLYNHHCKVWDWEHIMNGEHYSVVFEGQTLNFWVHKIEEGKINSLSINLMKFMTKISNLGHFSKPQVAADKENYIFAIFVIMKNLKKLREYLLGLKVEKYTREIIIIHHMMQPNLDRYNKGKEINVCSLRSLVDKIELLSTALVETLAQFAWIEMLMLMQSLEGMKVGVVLGIMCRYAFIQWDSGELNFHIATDDYCLGGLLTFHGWFNFVFDRGKF
ncbi:unnamed protein product [Trifolium pratense]|uniref:Uncharacterized protein n=1 Tax=Trifolium pratense TaxID=57577 RepID=A0ACB0LJ37_TRIPR|nr:unnamed protein product [Trifolium pratense]